MAGPATVLACFDVVQRFDYFLALAAGLPIPTMNDPI